MWGKLELGFRHSEFARGLKSRLGSVGFGALNPKGPKYLYSRM